jgi:hypothetical protein
MGSKKEENFSEEIEIMNIRKSSYVAVILMLFLLFSLLFMVPTGEVASDESTKIAQKEFAKLMVQTINKEREEAGVPALKSSEQLTELAVYKANSFAVDGSTVQENLKELLEELYEDITYLSSNEIVEYRQYENTYPTIAVEEWLTTGHKEKILSKNFNYIGVGYNSAGWVVYLLETNTILKMISTTVNESYLPSAPKMDFPTLYDGLSIISGFTKSQGSVNMRILDGYSGFSWNTRKNANDRSIIDQDLLYRTGKERTISSLDGDSFKLNKDHSFLDPRYYTFTKGNIVRFITWANGVPSKPIEYIVQEAPIPEKPVVQTAVNDERYVSGRATPGNAVHIKIRGRNSINYYFSRVKADGSFKADIGYWPSSTAILVTQINQYGKESGRQSYFIKTGKPPAAPKIDKVTNAASKLTVIGEKYSKAYIYRGSKKIGEGKLGRDGKQAISFLKQKTGTKLSIYLKDIGGNQGNATTVTVKKKYPPAKPKTSTISNKTKTITIYGEADATVYIYKGNKKLASSRLPESKKVSIRIPLQKAGTKLTIYQKDGAGNTSRKIYYTVKDKKAPSKPVLSKITKKTTMVTIKGEKGARVYIYRGKKLISKGTISMVKGNKTLRIPKQKSKTELKVVLKDKAGNISSPRIVKVK